MRRPLTIASALVLLGAGLVLSGPAWAADPEVTMDVVEDPEADQSVTNQIELPGEAAETGKESSRFGTDTANEARGKARGKGREFGQEVRERAQQLREEQQQGAAENARNPTLPDPPKRPD